jgi:hypothetical protein
MEVISAGLVFGHVYRYGRMERGREREREFNMPSTGASIRLKKVEMRIRITSVNSTAMLVYRFHILGAAPTHWVIERRMEQISQYIWVFSVGQR